MKNKALIDMVKNTYGFYHQKYVIMADGYTKTVDHYFTDKVIESHLEGRYALAVFAGEKATRFISVDIDAGGKKAVRRVVGAFIELGIPRDRIYISTSGRKGFHVDIFFSPWIYNEKAKNLYDLMIWQTGLDPKKVEFRPTHRQAIKVPLGVHASTGNRCWYLDPETLEPIERLDYIMEIKPIDAAVVKEILASWNKKRWNELYSEMICEKTGRDESVNKGLTFDDAYYEDKRITKCGTRHNVMVRIAIDLRHYGANRHQIQKALRGFYYKQDPVYIDTDEEKCMEDIDEISRWAEESVPVWQYREAERREIKPVVFTADDAGQILLGATSSARKIAFLIWTYCKIFGSSHISYETISKTVGCSLATTKTAIAKLLAAGVISRKSGGCHFRNGILVRQANTYFIPAKREVSEHDSRELVAEAYELREKLTAENVEELYYRMVGSIFRMEYLARFMTKPELEECRRVMNGADGEDPDAGWTEDVSCIQ